MAEHLGYFKAMCLKVSFNATSFTAEQLVSSGRGTVTAIGSAADHILAAAAGANLIAVATMGNTDPHAIYAQPKIKTLKDLEGGTLGYHINVTPAAVSRMPRGRSSRGTERISPIVYGCRGLRKMSSAVPRSMM